MRRAFSVCMAVIFGAMIAHAQTTTATTSPADVKKLIAQLSSDQWQQRQEAQEQLVAIGDPAKDAVKQLLAGSSDPEVRTAAESILERIATAQKRGPTRVTLHMKDSLPKNIF